MVLALFVQQASDGTNLFLSQYVVGSQRIAVCLTLSTSCSFSHGQKLSNYQRYTSISSTHMTSQQTFYQELAKIRADDFSGRPIRSASNFKSGCIELHQYRVEYLLQHEVYLSVLNHVEDSPLVAKSYLDRMRRYRPVLLTSSSQSSGSLLLAVCKGPETTPAQLQRRSVELLFAFERVLQGDDAVEILNQKPLELSPNAGVPSAVDLRMVSFLNPPTGERASVTRDGASMEGTPLYL